MNHPPARSLFTSELKTPKSETLLWRKAPANEVRKLRSAPLIVKYTNCVYFSQNAELLSSLDSASLRIFKPPTFPTSASSAGLRFQLSGPQQTSTPPAPGPDSAPGPDPGHPPLDSPRMATIQEDPSFDSHLDEEALEEAFGRREGSAQRSFEDLTEKSVTSRSDKAMLFRLQRQHQIDAKETQC